ncbi:3,4-dihydroxy-2-butanone-4-phosphate synthase [Pseudomonas sp. JS3066]|uniref:3,4-dihydroxy-2-butanone-4-phosphate synthase n=1 Tax=Pseudomonas sp. JS3066 TaxID=3090665 RepID=UPI002E7B8E97|nr:3,4-dihydroxy-2-butanone-4-phosphate synthase [Pseudomonas sp. JS3066]WVK94309.1 3,4-dihydroxy-2-butanone-4-phosphate synthase [Pseudomonas sp. JS3066]
MDSPQRLIEAMASGAMLVVTDDDEGEGSLVISAGRADAAAINFMAREARGLICLALTEERCKTLGLELMVPNSRARHGMGFTLSIEARTGVSTGISAADRARTIEVAVDPASSASDLVQPGHIFPLRAQPGGVMQRAGHVEAACDLARLAGLIPAAVLVGILDEDGEPARGQTLREFAQRHGLPLGSVADLIHYRILHEGTIRRSGEYPIQTRHGEFRVITYLDDYQGQLHLALVRGEVHRDRPALVRVQAAETLRDLLDSHPGQWNLDRSLARVAEEGAGVVVLLAQQETPAALIEQLQQGTHKPRPPSFPQRTLGIGAQILRDVGVRKMRLLSFPVNYKAVSGFELEVVEFVSLDQEQA